MSKPRHPKVIQIAILVAILSSCSSPGESASSGENAATPTTTTATPTTTTATPTTTTATPTTTTYETPDNIVASTQDGDSGSTMEVYIGLQNSTGDPIYSSKPAELSLTFVDASENELFSDNWDLTNSHLSSWTKTASGQKFKGFLIEIPMDSIDRSFTGSYGTLAIYLDYGSWYFEYDIDVSNLPEATDAEQEAFSFEQFMENSVPLSRVKTRSRDWRVTPLNAGCFTKMGNYGSIETGVRVDIELENTDNTINTFYDDSLLVIPGGATVDRAYDSTAVGADLIPGTTFNGYLFFEDLDCTAGTYRFVMSNWNGMYIDEEFTLGN